MLALANRWCDLPAPARLGSWILMFLALSIICGLCYQSPERISPGHTLQTQWRKVMPLRGEQNASSLSKPVPFSALIFQRSLVSWQPAPSGGELVLEGEWSALLAAFSQLAASDKAVKAFSIQPEKANLRMTLQLESISHD